MLSQSLPNACNSNLKGSLRSRLSFQWSFLSLHSKFMCRVELQGSFKPLKWFAEQAVELECGTCLKGLWAWLQRKGAVSEQLCLHRLGCTPHHWHDWQAAPGWGVLWGQFLHCSTVLTSNPGSTCLFKSKATSFGKVCSAYFNFNSVLGFVMK